MTHKAEVRYGRRRGGPATPVQVVHDHLQEDQLSMPRVCASSIDSAMTVQGTNQCHSNYLSLCPVSAIDSQNPQIRKIIFFFSLGTPPNIWVFCLSLISYFSLISLNKTCFCFTYSQECLFHHWHEQMNSGATVPGTWVKHNRAKNCTIVLKTGRIRQEKTKQQKEILQQFH